MPESDPDLLPDPPSWPKLVGTTSILWGALNLTCAGCGVIGILSPILMGSMMQTAFPDGMPPALQNPPVLIWFDLAFGAMVSLLLVGAGILLLLRKPVARPLHLLYALLALISGVIGIFLQLSVQAEIAQWVRDNPNTKYAQQQAAASTSVITSLVLGFSILLAFAWPLFCLVWFAAIKKDATEISRGAHTLV